MKTQHRLVEGREGRGERRKGEGRKGEGGKELLLE